MSTQIEITRKITITDDQISALLCCAFEGGSGYWCRIDKTVLTDDLKVSDFGEGGKMQKPGNYWHWSQLVPLVPGCHLVLGPYANEYDDDDHWILDRESLVIGLKVMAEKYTRHFDNFINENEDAETCDVYLQCCLFGEVVYR